jgi:uncharacterized membrane protein
VDTPPTPPAAQPPAPAPPRPAPARRLRKRLLFPLILLGLAGAALLWAYVRGTWADTVPHDPKSSAEGVVCQLYRTPEGHTPVRCAAVIDRPLDDVWKVVTDYEHYGDIFPTLRSAPVAVARDPDGRYHLSGVASSVLGDWPFDIHIRHTDSPEKKAASWDGGSGDVRLNRGSFVLTPLGADRTLLVYSLEVEIASYPNFLVRNLLLSRQPGVMKALIERLKG